MNTFSSLDNQVYKLAVRKGLPVHWSLGPANRGVLYFPSGGRCARSGSSAVALL